MADITYWAVEEGFYFIFLITDACSHKIIGYHVARGMSGEHALTALHMAQRSSAHALHGIIHHSDRGKQYCFGQYVQQLQQAGMRTSMTETFDPRDNAVAERVNGILKNELLAHHKILNIDQARAAPGRSGPHLQYATTAPQL
ncbi:MAG: transposase family protein [Flavobacteriales bacterium]|nr:transposase family protein [Flavobacteriales bacterium]